jgi:hypothetical protein
VKPRDANTGGTGGNRAETRLPPGAAAIKGGGGRLGAQWRSRWRQIEKDSEESFSLSALCCPAARPAAWPALYPLAALLGQARAPADPPKCRRLHGQRLCLVRSAADFSRKGIPRAHALPGQRSREAACRH